MLRNCIHFGISGLHACLRTLRIASSRPTVSQLVILLYHEIPDECRRSFASQMDQVQETANVVDLGKLPIALVGGLNVGITFDDALESTCRNAIAELLQRQLPCLVFVPTGSLGRHPAWISDSGHPGYRDRVISGDEVARLARQGVAIGSHTVNHVRLTRVTKVQQRRELEESRQELERITGKRIDTLAFPYGDFDEPVLELSKATGYCSVYSSIPEPMTCGAFLMSRVNVSGHDFPAAFSLKLKGHYCWEGLAVRCKHGIFRKGSNGGKTACG